MDCIFCKIANGEMPRQTVYEDDLVMVIMDAYPVVDGHALVIPKKHYSDYKELDNEILNHILKVANEVGSKMMEKLGSTGFTFLVNYGDRQKVKHFHLHLLPDFGLDTAGKAKHTVEENFNMITKM